MAADVLGDHARRSGFHRPSFSVVTLIHQIRAALPEGRPLPDATWLRRHRVILAWLWVQIAASLVFGLLTGHNPVQVAAAIVALAVIALLSASGRTGRKVRAGLAAVGLLSTAALMVHFSGGYVELHFLFFIIVAVVALYQDWSSFLIAIGYVVLHHGVIGVLASGSVFNHPAAIEYPWLWASIHGAFLLALSAACLVAWRLNEEEQARRLAVQARGEELLREREARFRSLIQHASDIIAVLDADGTLRFASPALERMLGESPETWYGRRPLDLVHPDDLERVRRAFARLLTRPNAIQTLEARLRHHDGSWRQVEMVTSNRLADPAVGGIIANLHDVTERTASAAALAEERDLLHLLMDSLPDQIFFKDTESRFLRINHAGAATLGLEHPDQAIGKNEREFLPETIASVNLADDRRVIENGAPIVDHVVSITAADGTVTWLSTTKAPTVDAAGNVTGLVGVSRDVTARKVLEAQLAHQAFHDPLTDLPNRALFEERLTHAVERAMQPPGLVAVLFLDLDDFKVINDTLGHDAGDVLLIEVGRRLRANVRPGDTVARFGGDEFVVLLEGVSDSEEAMAVADRLVDAFRPSFILGGREVFVSVSIGLAFGEEGARPDDYLRDADLALYVAKSKGKARHAVFDAAMRDETGNRVEREADLRHALIDRQLVVHYQPLIDLESGRVTEVEALVRWQHPTLGLLAPADFIPLAEETGLIVPLGQQVLEEACRQTRHWQLAHPAMADLIVAVNLAARQVQRPELVAEVGRALDESGLPPACLKLELTERVALLDVESATATLRALKALGVRLAIDDFGEGYSGLSYLRRCLIDDLKIDRSYVAGLGTEGFDAAMVRAVVVFAQEIGLAVTAEGIETIEQLAELRQIGCDRGQGFLFARPQPADQIDRMLDGGTDWRASLEPEPAGASPVDQPLDEWGGRGRLRVLQPVTPASGARVLVG